MEDIARNQQFPVFLSKSRCDSSGANLRSFTATNQSFSASHGSRKLSNCLLQRTESVRIERRRNFVIHRRHGTDLAAQHGNVGIACCVQSRTDRKLERKEGRSSHRIRALPAWTAEKVHSFRRTRPRLASVRNRPFRVATMGRRLSRPTHKTPNTQPRFRSAVFSTAASPRCRGCSFGMVSFASSQNTNKSLPLPDATKEFLPRCSESFPFPFADAAGMSVSISPIDSFQPTQRAQNSTNDKTRRDATHESGLSLTGRRPKEKQIHGRHRDVNVQRLEFLQICLHGLCLHLGHLLSPRFLGKALVDHELVHLRPSLERVETDVLDGFSVVVEDGEDGFLPPNPFDGNVCIVIDFAVDAISGVALEEEAQLLVLVQGSGGTTHDLAPDGLCEKIGTAREADGNQQKEQLSNHRGDGCV